MSIDLESTYLEIVQAARDNVMNAIMTQRDVAEATATSVSWLFENSEWNPILPGDSVAGAVTSGAVSGACELGACMNGVANGILRGAIDSGARTHAPMLDLIKLTSRSTIRAVVGLDGDLGSAVMGLLDAASAGAVGKDFTGESASSAAVDGAILGLGQTSWRATQVVREAIVAQKGKAGSRIESGLWTDRASRRSAVQDTAGDALLYRL